MRDMIVLSIAVLVASCVVLVLVVNMPVNKNPSLPFTKVYEIVDKLNSEGEVKLDMELRVRKDSSQLRLSLDNTVLEFNITRVVLYWRAPSPKLDNYTKNLWSPWGNGSHCGLASWLFIEDDGLVLRIYYVNTTLSTTDRISLVRGDTIELCFVASECRVLLGDIEVYRFSGYRKVQLIELLIRE